MEVRVELGILIPILQHMQFVTYLEVAVFQILMICLLLLYICNERPVSGHKARLMLVAEVAGHKSLHVTGV
jgi:uncharacterized membrane protein